MDHRVREKSGLADKTGSDLMKTAFSFKNPVLRISENDNASGKSLQIGYAEIFAGTMTGIRNPRSHEYELEDSPQEALEMLLIVNHLLRILQRAAVS